MKRFGMLCAAGLLLGCIVSSAQAEKIGIVDLQKILQTSPKMKAIQAKLEQSFGPRRTELVKMEESLKKDMETLKRDTAVMSRDQQKELEKKVVAAQQKLEFEGRKYQQELSAANNEAMEDFYGNVRGAIKRVAEKEKFDLILQKDAAPFSQDKLDVTQRVLKEII